MLHIPLNLLIFENNILKGLLTYLNYKKKFLLKLHKSYDLIFRITLCIRTRKINKCNVAHAALHWIRAYC